MKLQESGEMYLETILILSQKKPVVRSIDISDEMNYSKPSVSRAIKLLRENRYINVDKNGFITLTKSGREMAEKIYERHVVLTKILTDLGVNPEIASEDACRIEHVISEETFEIIKNKVNH
ncbi:MAG: metal-dependent transcriptional regulator [Erysipelotrichaceae bacterium]|nr:metal-dependent transcriptional regulator [Erysipelotrichaceae bacterium]